MATLVNWTWRGQGREAKPGLESQSQGKRFFWELILF
jgi:hypothetical protein